MTANGAGKPINQPRRRDKTPDDAWIRAFLHSGAWGALATVSDGQPFINTNLYVFDEEANVIYLHTARTGRTRSNVERSGRVCFSVSEMGRILPDEIALEFSVEYAGVTVFGRAAVVEDDDEKARALQSLLDKYAPHLKPDRDYRPADQKELDRTSVYRIDIESWSGKANVKPADFPGAFSYDDRRQPSPFTPGAPD
ncbi:MAG: pyridoxamine 5'-phosphate oxidase family protein [Gemmatimonadales bacterium]|jgi:nitroimidazol reductase NimA-like FMN-containing flavoprotein (pyridoxamine 5'-phosphate oxidase superfamily)